MATIREKGSCQWQVQVRRMGWPNQSATFRTKKEAEAWARKTEREMDLGLFVDQSHGRQTTLGQLIEIYLVEVTDQRPGETSRIAERSKFERFLREEPALCSYAATNLTPEVFEEYRDRRKLDRFRNGKQISPSTVNKELNQLKRVIDHRMRRLGIAVNPVNTRDVKRLSVHDERDVRLSAGQRQKLLDECYALRNKLIGPIVEFAFETGARRGNILRLEWRDINLTRRTALLRGIKNSRSPDQVVNHTIGLTPRAVEILGSLDQTEAQVFPITPNAFRLAFNRARKKAGLEFFRFHDTRHERVSSLFEAGWSMVHVMAQSGHRDPKSVKRYANISGEHLADRLSALGSDSGSLR